MSQKHQAGYMPWDRTGNRILVQSQLGKAKPSNYQLPPQHFIYGDLTPPNPQNAVDLMYRWNYHKNTQSNNLGKEKDLIKTNKQCVKNLLHTASDFYQFRQSKTIFKPFKQGTNQIKIKLPDQNFAYGKPLQLEDPIKLVIANDYGETDKFMRHSFYQTQSDQKSVEKRKLSAFITKNYKLMKETAQKRIEKFDWERRQSQHWKLSKFKDVPSRTSTFRKQLKQTLKNKPQELKVIDLDKI